MSEYDERNEVVNATAQVRDFVKSFNGDPEEVTKALILLDKDFMFEYTALARQIDRLFSDKRYIPLIAMFEYSNVVGLHNKVEGICVRSAQGNIEGIAKLADSIKEVANG